MVGTLKTRAMRQVYATSEATGCPTGQGTRVYATPLSGLTARKSKAGSLAIKVGGGDRTGSGGQRTGWSRIHPQASCPSHHTAISSISIPRPRRLVAGGGLSFIPPRRSGRGFQKGDSW